MAIDIAATTVFMRWYLRPGDGIRDVIHAGRAGSDVPARRTVWQLATFVAVLSAVSAIGWQLEINLPYDRATFLLTGQTQRWDGVYFGEFDGNVYVARRPAGNDAFYRSISIYSPSEIQDLRIQPGVQTLCTQVHRPSVTFVNAATHVWDTVVQHLRRTGQPVTRPPQQPQPNLPDGQCPAQP